MRASPPLAGNVQIGARKILCKLEKTPALK
jgi:hypothetical protein